jgi:aconitase B
MVYDCITEKLSELKETKRTKASSISTEINNLKLKLKEVERAEKQLIDTMLSGGLNDDLLALANQKATQLKRDKLALYERMEDLKSRDTGSEVAINLAKSWKNADYSRKKEVAMIMIHQIIISENGDTKVSWNI